MGAIKSFVKTATWTGAALAGLGLWASLPAGSARRRQLVHASFPDIPFAHRGLHDAGSGFPVSAGNEPGGREYVALARAMAAHTGYLTAAELEAADKTQAAEPGAHLSLVPENSLAAFAAACEAGYGIELDLQLTADKQVVVVHDDNLQRVAGDPRKISQLTYEELQQIPLFPPAAEQAWPGRPQYVPLFSEVLALVAGRVPLIVEYKMGNSLDRELMERGAALLDQYEGWYCMESFNPLAVRWYRQHRPEVVRGQLATQPSCKLLEIRTADDAAHWFAGRLLLNWLGRPDFVAYNWTGGNTPQLRLLRKAGLDAFPVAWTVRSETEFLESRRYFSRFIFECFLPQKVVD